MTNIVHAKFSILLSFRSHNLSQNSWHREDKGHQFLVKMRFHNSAHFVRMQVSPATMNTSTKILRRLKIELPQDLVLPVQKESESACNQGT